VIALALDRRVTREEGVLVAALTRLAELEGLVLLLGVEVVDDELLATIIAVAEDRRVVLVRELLQVEAHQDSETLAQVLYVAHAHLAGEVDTPVLAVVEIEFTHFDFRWRLLEHGFAAVEPEFVLLVHTALHEGQCSQLHTLMQFSFQQVGAPESHVDLREP